MILQYFKSKENEYKKSADKIYIYILQKSKILANRGYFKEMDFNSSFELISIILIFYLNLFKQKNSNDNKKINQQLMKNFINDIDQSLRDIGISDMSIGKNVKKYVKKFYYRVKIIDRILNNFNESELINYLNSLKNIEKNNTLKLASDFTDIFKDIKNINSCKY